MNSYKDQKYVNFINYKNTCIYFSINQLILIQHMKTRQISKVTRKQGLSSGNLVLDLLLAVDLGLTR